MPGIRKGRNVWAVICVSTTLVGTALLTDHRPTARGGDEATVAATVEPVEKDMHEFMEYVFEPTFQRLKPAMAEQPADNAGWKVIKADGLILAEGGNLLLSRQPEEHADVWVQLATLVRKHGGELYAAGKKKDFAAARTAYTAMIQRCNECHERFAGGEHQLEP
jgi:hypothetical protein